jgi:hypothetical protein
MDLIHETAARAPLTSLPHHERYGGGFGVIPAFVSDLFGAKISAATHGIMIGVWASAAVIGVPCFTSYTSSDYHFSGSTKITNPSAYIHNVHWLCALPCVGFFACLFLNVRADDRAVRQHKRDWRVRVFGAVLRINWAEGGVRLLGAAAQAAEFAALPVDARVSEVRVVDEDKTASAAADEAATAAAEDKTASAVADGQASPGAVAADEPEEPAEDLGTVSVSV